MTRAVAAVVLTVLFAGCGGTYIDDKHNFERAFGAKCPAELRVVHSVYIQTPHFTEEHMYYFDLVPTNSSEMPPWVTNAPGIVRADTDIGKIPWQLAPREDRPKWFAPGSPDLYNIWYKTNDSYVVLRSKQTGDIFVYGSVGM